MNALRITGLVLALAVATTACGKSEQEKQADEAKKQIEQAQRQIEDAAKKAQQAGEEAGRQAGKAAEEAGRAAGQAGSDAAKAGAEAAKGGAVAANEAAKGLEALAKGLQGMAAAGAAGPDGKPVEPVNFHDLQAAFVPLDGWEMGKATGSKMSMPVSYSQAEVRYHKGDAEITASITDSGYNQLLIAPFTMFLTSGYEKETENGFEKSTTVAGSPGWEKWDSSDKTGEVSAFVNKRFVVDFKGRGIDNNKVLYQLAQSSNLSKLASVK
jgi:hypothetical protein